ncbi:DUF6266 family protein [Pedobacter hartonius]|nr:DUF6266 family protein [Pedobacter hartonius]
MGKLINGPMGTNIGKLGGYVSYFLHGELVTRSIGVIDHWSDAQYANQMRTGLTTALLKPVKALINIGLKYSPKPKRSWSAYTQATSINKKQAIKGIYPDLEIDFEKVVLAIGDIPVPLNPQVQLSDGRIRFTWDADQQADGADQNDQVMCVAYFPETFQAFNQLSGAKRGEEKQDITLPSFTEEMRIETYICYVSEDRRRVSNSVYLGQLIWNKD